MNNKIRKYTSIAVLIVLLTSIACVVKLQISHKHTERGLKQHDCKSCEIIEIAKLNERLIIKKVFKITLFVGFSLLHIHYSLTDILSNTLVSQKVRMDN